MNGYLPEYFNASPLPNLDIIVRLLKSSSLSVSKKDLTEVASGLTYLKDERLVISTLSLLGLKATWAIRRLHGKPTEVFVNRVYQLLSKTLLAQPISTAFPDHALIQMVAHTKLLSKDYTFLVGACFEPDDSDKATIISSMGGMGKTTLVFEALKEMGGSFLSDDMVMINKAGNIYSYPKPVRTRHVSIPPMDLETYVLPSIILGSDHKIKKMSRVGTIVLLERASETEVQTLTSEDASNRLLTINRKLLPYYMERSLIAYSYMDSSFNLYALMKMEMDIIHSFLKHGTCYVLKSRFGDVESCLKLLRGLVNNDL